MHQTVPLTATKGLGFRVRALGLGFKLKNGRPCGFQRRRTDPQDGPSEGNFAGGPLRMPHLGSTWR